MGPESFFNGWGPLARVAVVGAAAYVLLVVMLRISGKRTLSKLNAFDFVVTVALGSTLATILMSRDTSLAEGVTALALLIALQFAVTWTSVRWKGVSRLVKSEPTVVLRDGRPIEDAMRRERLATGELVAAIRDSGGCDLEDARFVILEPDGSLVAVLRD